MSPEQVALFDSLPEFTRAPDPGYRPIERPVWTENKARFVERYLYLFVLVTKHGTYIDGFAGPQAPSCVDACAANLVMNSRPQRLRDFFLCEKKPHKLDLLRELADAAAAREGGPARDRIRILPGDFNAHIDDILASSACGPTVAQFALLDQHTFECQWQTVEKIANHRPPGRRTELLYFLGTGWMDRALAATRNHGLLERWWGDGSWRDLRPLNSNDRVALFCERVRNKLGYGYATPWPVFKRREGGPVMYHLVHATDHPRASQLMERAYREAVHPVEPGRQYDLELEVRELMADEVLDDQASPPQQPSR